MIAPVGRCQTLTGYSRSRGHFIFQRGARGVMASTGGVFLVPDANFPKADWPLSSAVRIMIVLSIKCKGSARRTDVKRNSRASFFLKYSKAKNAAVAARRAQTLAKQNQACRAATEASPRRGPVGLCAVLLPDPKPLSFKRGGLCAICCW